MALRSLIVELGVNIAKYTEGLNKATYQARQFGQDVSKHLETIGGAVSNLGSHFGILGGIIGSSMSSASSVVGKLAKEISSSGGLTSVLGLAGVGAIGVGAAMATAGVAVAGIAIHAAEGAAKLYELSQSTGVAVQVLSGLGVVGKLVGIDIETLSKGLERMDKSALAAAQSPNLTTNAYRTLGISVTDASGHLKNTIDIFGEVADKFSNMEDGATKTALAMQIFGKAGANLIPVLNKGSEAIKYWVDYGTKVGAVLTENAAKGAHDFEEQMTKLGLISTGVQNKLMAALLPAIDHITEALTTFAEKGNTIQHFGEIVGKVLVGVAKLTFEAAYAWDWWGTKLDIWKAKFEKIDIESHAKIFGWNPDKVKQRLAQLDGIINHGTDEIQKSRDRLDILLADLENPNVSPAGPGEKKGTKKVPPTVKPLDLAAAKVPVNEVTKYIETLQHATDVETALSKSIGNTTEEIKRQETIAAEQNSIDKLREGLVTKQISLQETLAAAKAEGGSKNEKQIANLQREIKFIGDEIVQLDAATPSILAMAEAKGKASENVAFQKSMVGEIEKIYAEVAALDEETAAIGISAEAKRKAAAIAATEKFTAKYPEVDSGALLDANNKLQESTFKKQIANEKEALSTTKGYMDEIALIRATMAANKDNEDIQLAGAAAIQAANNKVTQAWDNNALAVGNFGEKTRAVLNELALENQNVGKNIAGAFKTFFDGVSTQFADMVTKGKFSFSSLFDSLENAIVKQLASAALNKLITSLGSLGQNQSDNNFLDTGSTSGSGGGGGFLGMLGGLFGGGLAEGGDVTPGKAYVVGEKHPEFFVPKQTGAVVPSLRAGKAPMNASVTMHVYGATDADSFRKSGPQIAAEAYRHLAMAHAHANGGDF